MEGKYTVIIGASPDPTRYSNKAAHQLEAAGHPIELLGIRPGEIVGRPIQTDRPLFENVDTVTLYVGPQHQAEWIDYLVSLKPQRVLFNPGTENPVLQEALDKAGIAWEEACTLVLLSLSQY